MARKITVIPAQPKQTQQTESGKPAKIRVAAYCRVSTDQEEQLNSYENQIKYYKSIEESHPEYELVGVYADEGISGTNTKKRVEFNRMIADCRCGKIDRILTKSISRFARNTLDCLNYIRELQQLGIEIIFENENINTMDGQGEVLITILSGLAQSTSQNISSNSKWGIHRRYEQGQYGLATTRFLGYDQDEEGNLIVNRKQAKLVKRIYKEFMEGKTVDHIARVLTREKVKNWNGKAVWHATTLQSMLCNEKYMGDAILQKGYTADFLTKRRAKNSGEMKQYYIEDDHEAIIEPEYWNAVQLEMKRREDYLSEHQMQRYGNEPEKNPMACRVICGNCGRMFTRKNWRKRDGSVRPIWQCAERYKVKGVLGCDNRHVDEDILMQVFVLAWNQLIGQKEELISKWKQVARSENELEKFYANAFIEKVDKVGTIKEFDTFLFLATVESLNVYEDGRMMVRFLEGSEITIAGE